MSALDIPLQTSPKGIVAAKQVLDVVVLHPDFDQVLNASVAAVDLVTNIRMPTGVILMADPGMGKTLFLEMLARRLTSSDKSIGRGRPVLHIALDSAVDTHKLAGKILLALGYPMLPTRPVLDNMNEMIKKAMERLNPLALLIDEGQHICEGNREITARAVTDWLKVRMENHNLPLIMVGTRTLEKIYEINPQFCSRVAAEYFINPFQFGEAWQQLLQSFVEQVKTVDLACLSKTAISRAVFSASKSNFRRLKKLLVHACIEAADLDVPILTAMHLQLGYTAAFGVSSGTGNPFDRLVQ